jgi:Ion channel
MPFYPAAMMRPAQIRLQFLVVLWREFRVVWPVVSGLFAMQLLLGFLIGRFEEWRIGDAIYFTFVTGLTVGYGDVVPLRFISRALSVIIALIGILLTAMMAAVAVRALQEATKSDGDTR